MKRSLFLLALALVLLPSTALAFGPVAHVDMALEILSSAGLIGGALASLLTRCRRQFVMGTLDPDRTLAKNLAPYEEHSHNWDLALADYDAAQTDEEQARSLGRICHLAADTVAHNYFVPKKIVDSVDATGAGHFYWEVRFDTRLRELRGATGLADMEFNDPAEIRYLRNIIRPTLATRGLNARLTGMSMAIQRFESYKTATRSIDRRSRLELTDDELMDIRSMALQAQITALNDVVGRSSDIFKLDPRGISCIQKSRDARVSLKAIRHAGQEIQVGERLRHHDFFRNLVVSKLQG